MNTIIHKVMFFLTGGQSGFAFPLSHQWHGVDLYLPLVLAGTVACIAAIICLGVGMARWYNAKRKAASIAFIAALALTTAAYAASSTLAALSAVSSVAGTDLFYDVQGGADYKATAAQIASYAASTMTLSAGCMATVTNSGTPPLTIGTQEVPETTRTTGNYATTDCGNLVNYSSASDQTPTLPLAATAGNGFYFDTCNIGTHAQTVTASGSNTVGGVGQSTDVIGTGAAPIFPCRKYVSDGVSNYWSIPFSVTSASTTTFTNKTFASSTDNLGGVTADFGSDAKGDIYTNGGSSNVITRLAIGSTGYCLQVASGLPSWAACPLVNEALATGSSTGNTLTAPSGYFICTSTCTVTPPVPAAGYQFCVMNDDNVGTVITLGALGSSAYYENTARTAYGTAGTGTLTSGGAKGDMICIVGRDTTHYLSPTYVGSWTAS